MLPINKLMQLHDEACEARHCNGSHLYNQVAAEKRNEFKKALELELTSAEGYWDGYSQLKEEIAMALNKAGFNLLDQNTGYKVVKRND